MISIYKVGIINIIVFYFKNDNSFCNILQTRKICQFVKTKIYVFDIYTEIKIWVLNVFYVIPW